MTNLPPCDMPLMPGHGEITTLLVRFGDGDPGAESLAETTARRLEAIRRRAAFR